VWGGAVKAEAAKCVLGIPDAGPRTQELARSRALTDHVVCDKTSRFSSRINHIDKRMVPEY
jgi:hypothetical protein